MAELEEEQYANSQAAQEWRKKTVNAEADPAWLCDACGTLHPVWQPHCSHCHAFDSITWRQPGLRYLQSDDIRKTG